MSVYADDDRILYDEQGTLSDEKQAEVLASISSRINKGGEPPTTTMEAEKRIRREIANSNERRRMQSINNGFQSLRSLLPHHEGEKLSKAAILQQTAEYIYTLEQEKTRLLSQNSQLKRLVSQHESGSGGGGGGDLPPKKRKAEIILPTVTAESSDEGFGSMSPEPVGLINVTSITVAEPPVPQSTLTELRRQLERERSLRLVLEEQVRQFESQLFQQQQQQAAAQIYQVEEEEEEETEELDLQLVTAESLPPVAHTQTVVCSPPVSRSPSPEPPSTTEHHPQQPPPLPLPQKLPSVLEAAIKAEPKVEVERLPTPPPSSAAAVAAHHEEPTAPSRLYVSNTSRQNLETIVEAIRHLEGDHMFSEEPSANQQQQQQDVPLALTTKNQKTTSQLAGATTSSPTATARTATLMEFSAAMVQQSQQSRPGVIVVKQAS